MSLAAGNAISLAYGPKVLLDEETFAIGPQDRIGLVGANGTGKSSLMRILAGQLSPDSGELVFRRGARVGYLPQDVAALPDLPLVEAVLATVPGRAELEVRLRAAEDALAAAREPEEQLELSGALADLHAALDHFEERFGRHRAERILGGLAFTAGDLARPARTFSGGWKMRAALAGLLLQDPDLLLLDEPTNHLDVPTLEWFDAFLRGTRRALLLVSHDREFLNRQIDRVLALEPEGLRAYTGDYEDYKRQRAQEEERLLAEAKRQGAKRAQLEEFIERFGAKATKARQAKSKEKLLEKMEEVQVLEHRATVRFRFAEAPRSGREVLRLEGVRKAFGPRVVYRSLDAAIQRGERVGVIGANGAGKSTLLKLVAGELAADAGAVKLGHGVLAGYFAQHHFAGGEERLSPPDPPLAPAQPHPATPPLARASESSMRTPGGLDPDRTVLDTLWDLVPDKGEAYVRGVAGSFLFSGDDVEKRLGVLSGGERARVALAKLLLVPANLLVLDEPTNHLDLDSSEALIEALKGFGGTLLFVSHNRSFLNQLATVIWEVKDGGLLPFPGNLDDWLYHQKELEAAAAASGTAGDGPTRAGSSAAAPPANDKERRRLEAEARNARYRLEKPLRERIAALEARIEALEREEREATEALADPALYQDFARAKPLIERQHAAKEELARLYAEWETAQEELAALQTGS
ncbi:ABC-F family ATP-binding cassette domain-containing protein [Anaeromyxobacter sp. Fw109-5]|uniref:ABC-F family ATP-binding cassette domain-containing protein n=1 Tax=Anaeromyxobacter sp. (strain Fw109-5) TaxID=404589 RepID=UPI0000ED7F8A|nr:ABC-F family ATP-binding cassette domain-containing protein [Anaeromyxobacter sp. Fw109-5]ABS25087.1 ABC transporter related [Anaeromyxobacter sp. Fw109-5]